MDGRKLQTACSHRPPSQPGRRVRRGDYGPFWTAEVRGSELEVQSLQAWPASKRNHRSAARLGSRVVGRSSEDSQEWLPHGYPTPRVLKKEAANNWKQRKGLRKSGQRENKRRQPCKNKGFGRVHRSKARESGSAWGWHPRVLYECANKGVAGKGICKVVILKGDRFHQRGHAEHRDCEGERKEAAGKRFSRFMIARK